MTTDHPAGRSGAPNLHPYLVRGHPETLAHRGASGAHPPGNSIPAFAAALEAGIDHIETDVQVTADGVVVLFHDERLDEATTATGTIGGHTWERLRDVRLVADGETTSDGLVRLDEILDQFPDAFFNIDVKTDAAVDPTVEILRERDARQRVCVAAFSWRRLRRLRKSLGPSWCSATSKLEIAVLRILAWLRLPVPRLGDAVQLPTTHRGIALVDRRFVDACHRAGMVVHVWTINDRKEADRLRGLGVDGIISDRPAEVGTGLAD